MAIRFLEAAVRHGSRDQARRRGQGWYGTRASRAAHSQVAKQMVDPALAPVVRCQHHTADNPVSQVVPRLDRCAAW
jgi:hypothetical protein